MTLKNEICLYHVSLTTAKLLKDLGYRVVYPNDPIFNSYWQGTLTSTTPEYNFPEDEDRYLKYERFFAPSLDLASKWILENFGYNIVCHQEISDSGEVGYDFRIELGGTTYTISADLYPTKDEAEASGIEYTLLNFIQ